MACGGLAVLNTEWHPLSWWWGDKNTPWNIKKEVKVPPWKTANWKPWYMCTAQFCIGDYVGRLYKVFPSCDYFLYFKRRSACTPQFYSFRSRISPQWFSNPRRQWMSIPWKVVCELVSLMGFHTTHGQHSQPALLAQGCMHVLTVTCHLHFWQNENGLFYEHYQGQNQYQNNQTEY